VPVFSQIKDADEGDLGTKLQGVEAQKGKKTRGRAANQTAGLNEKKAVSSGRKGNDLHGPTGSQNARASRSKKCKKKSGNHAEGRR